MEYYFNYFPIEYLFHKPNETYKSIYIYRQKKIKDLN
jgi:hypothetical protein